MRTIYAEYNINHDSIDVYTSAGYMLRIDCWEAEKDLKTTYGSECALTSLAVDEPLEYARLYLEGNLQMWVDAEDLYKIIYIFLTIFLYLLKCPQSLILSALRAFCFCGKPHISRSIFLYFRYQAWLKSW